LYHQARIGLSQLSAARRADPVAVHAALGGNWQEDTERKVTADSIV
jgi:hypothetical protein